ncbi:MAG: DegT/DnrJ/EryC1/StrS family aminotransferase [Actinobacteria bacterium]|nr:DegT/DnrJ/EryC1/StrS family aminotransferase [Actinomycetota bacterium]
MSEKAIPLVDLVSQHLALSDEIGRTLSDVIADGSFTLGSPVKMFEEEFASYCGARHAIGVGSGSDALHLALRALRVGPGDDVITTPNTFIATIEAIIRCGARPVLVDVDEDTYLMDPARLEGAITGRTKAIVPVHLYGQPADMEEICGMAAEHGVKVIEDACQAHGASINGMKVSHFGDAACFSFYPSKNLGALGDGGIVVTDDSEVAERVARLRNHGESGKYNHAEPGFCSRLDSIQAAVLRVKLKYLDRWNTERRRGAELYNALFKDSPVVVPFCKPSNDHVYHLYVIRVENRNLLQERLAGRNIQTGIHYPIPLHLQPSTKEYGYGRGDFPVAERLADQIISLPMFPGLRKPDIERVAYEVIEFSLSGSGVA